MHELVERIQDERRDRWERGERVPVEAYLERYPALYADAAVVVDLVYGEVLLREALGEPAAAGEYLRRFPEFMGPLRRQFRLHECLREGILGPAETPRSHLSTADSTLPQRPPSAPDVALPTIPGYEILGRLGKGGRGVVYRARQLRPNRVVALKMIRYDEDATEPGGLALFRREAEAVARLEHPNIIRLYEFGEHAGRPYFTMELAAGGSLEERLGAGPLGPREAAALVETLARAVHAVHRQEHGIVHRDLKPANVLLAADGTPKIADFGLAKRLGGGDSLFPTGAIVGTASYMAPEQAAGGKDIGPETDVYALGAILYECLTGRPPFRGENWWDTLNRVRSREPVPPCRLDPRLPRDLETVCLKCLAKDPRRRYASAEELADRLRLFLEDKPVPDRLSRWPAKLWQTIRSHRRHSAAALLLTALLAGLLAANSYLEPDPTKREFSDPERARGEAEARLAKGLPYEFEGHERLPGPFRWVISDAGPPRRNPAERCFTLEVLDRGLLEVVADPHLERYQFSADIRHDSDARDSLVGIYFGYCQRRDRDTVESNYYTLTFADRGSLAGAIEGVNGEKRSRVQLEGRTYKSRKMAPLVGNVPFTFALYPPVPPTVLNYSQPAPWRRLVVRVTPEGVEALWAEDGKHLQRVGEGKITKERLEADMQRHRPIAGLQGDTMPFRPRAGLGLYLLRAKASFRRIIVEPLKGGN